MTKFVYDAKNNPLPSEDGEPQCGEDFCDQCGDCLYCYQDDPCFVAGTHYWVEYRD